MPGRDVRQLPLNDQVALGAGVLAFIWSLFNIYYGASAGIGSFHVHANVNAWHFGWNVLAMLLILAATLVVAAQVFASDSMPQMPVSMNFLAAGLSCLGTLLLIIRSFTAKHGSALGFSYGLRWGAYVLMILCLAQAVATVMRLRASGEAMPWEHPAAPPAAPPAAS